MISAISLMRQRADIGTAQFRKHWLDPHGVMTAGLPGLSWYVQSHCIEHPANNRLARSLAIGGFPELRFASLQERRIAYTSPRIAECNVDSEHFIGAVKRLVTEPEELALAAPGPAPATVILLGIGAPDEGWAHAAWTRCSRLPGVATYTRHRLLEQAAAPDSRIAELAVPVAGIAKVTFASEAALLASASQLTGDLPSDERTAVFAVEDFKLR